MSKSDKLRGVHKQQFVFGREREEVAGSIIIATRRSDGRSSHSDTDVADWIHFDCEPTDLELRS